jgi:hypothetical protein
MRHIGRKPKIDKRKLHNMLRQGRSQTDCAKHFGVSPSAINQAKKNLTLGIAKNVALETGAVIVEESLDSISQLKKINGHTIKLVDLIAGWVDGDPDAIKTLQRHHQLGGIGGKKGMSFRDPKELLLKAVQEVRGQVKLSLDIYESLYNMRTIQSFQEEVLNVIAKQNPEVRDEIVKRLKQRNAVRSIMRIT